MRAVLARHTHEFVSRSEVRALAGDRGLAGRQTCRGYHGPTLLTHVGRGDVGARHEPAARDAAHHAARHQPPHTRSATGRSACSATMKRRTIAHGSIPPSRTRIKEAKEEKTLEARLSKALEALEAQASRAALSRQTKTPQQRCHTCHAGGRPSRAQGGHHAPSPQTAHLHQPCVP